MPFGYDAAAFAGEAPPARTTASASSTWASSTPSRPPPGAGPAASDGCSAAIPGQTSWPARRCHLMGGAERLDTDRIELHLAGKLSAADEEILAGSPLVHRHGYLPHAEAVALMRSADLLFLPMQDAPGRAGLDPGKTYEYLAAGRPILAAVPEGDARDLLGEAGAHIVEPTDEAAMAGSHPRRAGAPEPAPQASLEPYEYAAVTRSLAEILDGVLGR